MTLLDAELLDRERELEMLRGCVAAAVAGSGQFVVIEGPAGIGKTRLLYAVRDEALRAGMRPVTARSSELEREFGHGVVRQLFEPILADHTGGALDGSSGGAERGDLLSGAAAQAGSLFEQVDAARDGEAAVTSFATLHGL